MRAHTGDILFSFIALKMPLRLISTAEYSHAGKRTQIIVHNAGRVSKLFLSRTRRTKTEFKDKDKNEKVRYEKRNAWRQQKGVNDLREGDLYPIIQEKYTPDSIVQLLKFAGIVDTEIVKKYPKIKRK